MNDGDVVCVCVGVGIDVGIGIGVRVGVVIGVYVGFVIGVGSVCEGICFFAFPYLLPFFFPLACHTDGDGRIQWFEVAQELDRQGLPYNEDYLLEFFRFSEVGGGLVCVCVYVYVCVYDVHNFACGVTVFKLIFFFFFVFFFSKNSPPTIYPLV